MVMPSGPGSAALRPSPSWAAPPVSTACVEGGQQLTDVDVLAAAGIQRCCLCQQRSWRCFLRPCNGASACKRSGSHLHLSASWRSHRHDGGLVAAATSAHAGGRHAQLPALVAAFGRLVAALEHREGEVFGSAPALRAGLSSAWSPGLPGAAGSRARARAGGCAHALGPAGTHAPTPSSPRPQGPSSPALWHSGPRLAPRCPAGQAASRWRAVSHQVAELGSEPLACSGRRASPKPRSASQDTSLGQQLPGARHACAGLQGALAEAISCLALGGGHGEAGGGECDHGRNTQRPAAGHGLSGRRAGGGRGRASTASRQALERSARGLQGLRVARACTAPGLLARAACATHRAPSGGRGCVDGRAASAAGRQQLSNGTIGRRPMAGTAAACCHPRSGVSPSRRRWCQQTPHASAPAAP